MKPLFFKLLFLTLFSLSPLFASAGTEHNMSGFAWSSNIGWISFNCTNTNTCGTVNYGVHKASDGRLCGNESCSLPGYAWSSNIGWIQFGGIGSGFPSGSGTQGIDAKVNGTNLKGWARALSYGGGWDGWISFSGSGYGVNFIDSLFSSYAWGSDALGWISFDVAGDDGVKAFDVSLDVQNDSGVSLVGNSLVPYETVPTFVWGLTGVSGPCDITKTAGGSSFTPITNITAGGSQVGSILNVEGLHTYSIDCTNPTVSKEVSFTVTGQSPAFTLGPADNVRIQILPLGTSDSELKTIFVEPNAAFVTAGNPVDITITTYPTAPASTTFMYSFDSGAHYYAQGSPSLTKTISKESSPYYAQGLGFKVRIIRLAGAGELVGPYPIRFTGSSSGPLSVTKDMTINLVPFNPTYQEI